MTEAGLSPIFDGSNPHYAMRTGSNLLLLVLAMGIAQIVGAQYNQKGTVHLAIGGAIGAHATELDERITFLGATFSQTKTDGAATTTVPIEVGYALGNHFSLGLLIEPGRYVNDTAQTEQSNSIAVVAIQPRFYLVNKERLALTASLQIGGAALRIQDDTPGEKLDARLSGTAFGLGTGLVFAITDHFGLDFQLRYLATNMELRAAEVNGSSVMDFYAATLRTGGVIGQLSLAFRLGGD